MTWTIFDCLYNIDGIDRHVWFRVPDVVPVPKDCVIWVHGGGQIGRFFAQLVPPRPDRIDVFPSALESNGEEIFDPVYGIMTNCLMPRIWITPGVPTLPPFSPAYSGPGPDCRTHPFTIDPYTGLAVQHQVQPGADPKCPWPVAHSVAAGGGADDFTDFRFLCKLVSEVKTGNAPLNWRSSNTMSAPSTWTTPPVRVWLAGFSKGGLLVLFAHAYNKPAIYAPGVSGISELDQIAGYFMSSAPMPQYPAWNFADIATFAPETTNKVCGYWHGDAVYDTHGALHLPGRSWSDSAEILKNWYGGPTAGWSTWLQPIGQSIVCSPHGPTGYVQTRVAEDAAGVPLPFREYEVIGGGHAWTACPGGWDEALVATNLWRTLPAPYGFGT